MQVLFLALIGYLEGSHLLFLQPLAHGSQEILRLGVVDSLSTTTGSGCNIQRRRVGRQVALEIVVQAREPEEDLIR
ncbi:hypothetical protein D3C84_1188330 [compost metagenome]